MSGKKQGTRPEDTIQYKRPTVAVRQRPYLFLYQYSTAEFRVGIQNNPIRFLPQGNAATGNRVTWGWWIRAIVPSGSGTKLLLNGLAINVPGGMGELTLVDTTKNAAGIDVTEYEIMFMGGDPVQILAVEQILQIAAL